MSTDYDYLAHHGIKGMKWGVRRFQKKDGTLTPAGKKRYDYTPDRDGLSPKFKVPTGAKVDGYVKQKTPFGARSIGPTEQRKLPIGTKVDGPPERRKLPMGTKVDGPSKGNAKIKEKTAKAVVKGAEVAGKLMMASTVDDIFYGGAGKKIAKEAVIQTGRAAVTAYTMARGGYDIKWYDNQGRRVG